MISIAFSAEITIPFLEKYKMEDAEIAFFIQGAHANTCKSAIHHLRNQGRKGRDGETAMDPTLADRSDRRSPFSGRRQWDASKPAPLMVVQRGAET